MTQTAQQMQPPFSSPPETLETLLGDLTSLWHQATQRGPSITAKATEIFARHPGAQTNLAVALLIRNELRSLLGLTPLHPPVELLPFGTSVTQPQVIQFQPTLTALQDEQETDKDAEDASDDVARPGDRVAAVNDEEHHTPDVTEAASVPPRAPVALPDVGFFQALFPMMPDNGSVALTLTRIGDLMRVIITPTLGTGEASANIQSQTLTHFPDILDRDFAGVIQPYTRQQLSLQEQVTANAARPASKPAASTPPVSNAARQTSTLNIKVTPKDAQVSIDGGTPRTAKNGTATFQQQGRGEHTVTVSKDGFDPQDLKVTLKHPLHDVPVKLLAAGAGIRLTDLPEGATITAEDEAGKHYQGKDDTVMGLPAGINTVTINHPDFETYQKSLQGTLGEIRTHSVQMKPKASNSLF